jgi:hypothetical protein
MRLIVILLALANLGYYAWSQGALAVLGMQPASFSERESQRLQQQVRAEMLEVRVLDPGAP